MPIHLYTDMTYLCLTDLARPTQKYSGENPHTIFWDVWPGPGPNPESSLDLETIPNVGPIHEVFNSDRSVIQAPVSSIIRSPGPNINLGSIVNVNVIVWACVKLQPMRHIYSSFQARITHSYPTH